mmetsp:Transcript_38554/g.75713  ORF Transcript_38554/g.75713 Transcript_38554/m.75713 type:complete len:106 (-) Transcript_38554:83-400(-)
MHATGETETPRQGLETDKETVIWCSVFGISEVSLHGPVSRCSCAHRHVRTQLCKLHKRPEYDPPIFGQHGSMGTGSSPCIEGSSGLVAHTSHKAGQRNSQCSHIL